jgi:cell division protease FtsH
LNDLAKNVILWIVVAVVLWSVVSNFGVRGPRVTATEYSTFLSWVRDGSVKEVVFEDKTLRGERTSGDTFVVYNPETSNEA